MTDRDKLLQDAYELESSVNAEHLRQDEIRSIKKSLSGTALKVVEDEARVRTMLTFEMDKYRSRTPSSYSMLKSLNVDRVIGEWYIDQKKPLESRVAEQVEA
ncbi:MAG: hypothetical protein AAB701_01445 [Patescibacteria group bacterium]